VILSTHLVEDVRNLCSQMAIINKGKLVATGKPSEMVAALNGNIWSKQIDKRSLPEYEDTYPVICKQLIEKSLYITVLGTEPPEGFLPAIPTLEHVYFHWLKKDE